jgi:predicted dehydrogenase
MEVYGQTGIIVAKDRNSVSYRFREENRDSLMRIPERKAPYDDPFTFFKAVVRKSIKMDDNDLSALPLNMTVMEILEAAKKSATEGKTIYLKASR